MASDKMLSLAGIGRTHAGYVRRRNEDALYVGRWLHVVADGLGGHVAGDIASSTAVEAVKRYDQCVPSADLADTLGHAIGAADAAIRARVREDPELTGMGTTMVALLHSDDAAVLANIGDSRAYLTRKSSNAHDALVQVTEDHTYQYLLAEAARVPNLPERLARFLDGRADGRSPDLTAIHFRPGDRLLLCSDGLSSYVPESTIAEILRSPAPSGDVPDLLIAAALDHGGPDNVTVIVIDAEASPGASESYS